MLRPGRYIFLISILPCLLSCSGRPDRAGEPRDARPPLTDSLYCFNGRYIVSDGTLKGLMDEDGRLLLPPEYEELEFIDDEIAIGRTAGRWFLMTRDGRTFASDHDAGILESECHEQYEAMLDEDSAYWNEVLDRLDSLCDSCLGVRGRDLSGELPVIRNFEELKRHLSAARGQMTDGQKERLAAIKDRFNQYRR